MIKKKKMSKKFKRQQQKYGSGEVWAKLRHNDWLISGGGSGIEIMVLKLSPKQFTTVFFLFKIKTKQSKKTNLPR